MLTNAELLQRLRTLSEQVPEGEGTRGTWTGDRWDIMRLYGSAGMTRKSRLVHAEEIDLACTLRNALPQILEALEQSDRLRSALTEIATSCDWFHRGAGLRGVGTHSAAVKALAVAALEGPEVSE